MSIVTVNVNSPGQVHVKRHGRRVGQPGRLCPPVRVPVSSPAVDVDNRSTEPTGFYNGPLSSSEKDGKVPASFSEAMGVDSSVDQSPFSRDFQGIVKNVREHEGTDGNVVGGTALEQSTFLQHEPSVSEVVNDRHDFESTRDETPSPAPSHEFDFGEATTSALHAGEQAELAVEAEAKALPGQAGAAREKLSVIGKSVGEKIGGLFKSVEPIEPSAELKAAREEREAARRRKQAADDRLKAAIKRRASTASGQVLSPLERAGTAIEEKKAGFVEKLAQSIEGDNPA